MLFLLVVLRLAIVAEQLETSRGRLEYDATHDALTGLGNRALYSERVRQALAVADDDAVAHRGAVHRPRRLQDRQRQPRPRRRRPHAAGDRRPPAFGRAPRRLGRPTRRRRVRDPGRRRAGRRRARDRRPAAGGALPSRSCSDPIATAHSGASIGIAFGSIRTTPSSRCSATPTSPCTPPRTTARARWEVYRPGMRQQVLERFELRADLTHALERDEFFLHYQPIIEVDIGRGEAAVEALVRWQHPDEGPDRSGPLHLARRGDRSDRPDRALDPPRGVRPGAEPRSEPGRPAHRRQRQRRPAATRRTSPTT